MFLLLSWHVLKGKTKDSMTGFNYEGAGLTFQFYLPLATSRLHTPVQTPSAPSQPQRKVSIDRIILPVLVLPKLWTNAYLD
jgi:hypothetical protein